jgi:endonuclease/exonuclease/phosphatase family metal-dependent hydrolase
VLTGDFNAVETEPAIHLVRECFNDSFREKNPHDPGHTWATSNPLTGRFPIADRRLDYIFCPSGAEIHKAEIVLDQSSKGYASDHFGVLADLEWREAKKEAA